MKKVFVLAGAVLAAIAASSCCILPLILGAAGAGSLGFASLLAPYRPYLTALTLALLGAGFYFAYRPAKECAGSCTTRLPATRTTRYVLWVVTLFTLATIAYPQVALLTLNRRPPLRNVAVPASAQTVTYSIPSMDCPACAANIESRLQHAPGVYEARVDFGTKRAVVRYNPGSTSARTLKQVIAETGFLPQDTVPAE
ncbi:MAG: mercuric transporter MerT family protein [Chthonomonadales bacterium]